MSSQSLWKWLLDGQTLNDTHDVDVSGWLDDIGLPQYKSHFDEARVDGRMLHYMTVVSSRLFNHSSYNLPSK